MADRLVSLDHFQGVMADRRVSLANMLDLHL